ncbi:biosynthetic-type acetolactate synthase large subunit [Paenibacillus mesophilus]|uniref:biosynthetic-type acetolactate synthase large subunit n=1 Tax=Paenibacillus mesophilus TaxID=2582849 RepID=UPI00110E4F8E|nr:biosynthetic-type acetolactate synthase large subunit [Paenibacillus mesophilus]TMV49651.1 biosynthetic-type acetolactate synthase large subunit [Paenibacillus mesophilus]
MHDTKAEEKTDYSVPVNDPALRERLMEPDRISGSEILLRSLLLEGVECVFGYPGGAVLYIYDAMHGNPHFRHVLTRHEQGAIHAADGYARSTGKTGVCIATSGPGATNLVTGIATAHMDSVPLVVITGNVAATLIGTDSFQEADIVGITQPITKHSYFVRSAADLPRIVREAFHIAGTGRKGPVLIDIPKDVSAEEAVFRYPAGISIPGYNPSPAAPGLLQRIDELLAAVEAAERPLLLAGAGVVAADAGSELVTFAEKTRVPVTTTLLGLGGFPSGHGLWLGMPGMHGTVAANRALQECDLLISAGARFDDRVTMRLDGFAPGARIVHIDIDAAEIGKLVPTAISVQGDVHDVLNAANALLIERGRGEASASRAGTFGPSDAKAAWLRRLDSLKRQYPLRYTDTEHPLKPQAVIEMISGTTGGEAIITTDVGQHQMWTAQYYKFNRPRSLVTSGGLGTMGFGFPAAIGAQIGNPDRLVVSINGDGGMQMCSQELAICAIHNIPVKIVVINNRTLGMIKQWQELIYDRRYSHIDLSGSPDFVKLAEAYGVKGLRADNKHDARLAWQEALDTPGPVLIDFVVSKDELVYPMVPQGKPLGDMIVGEGRNNGDT